MAARPSDAKTRQTCFYILTHSEAPGVCKPGSTGWVRKRQQTTQGAFPFGTVSIAYTLNTKHYRDIEKRVKRHFADRSLNGDWLNVSVEEVISFISTLPLVGANHVEETSQLVLGFVE